MWSHCGHLCNYISFWLLEGQELRVGVFCVVTKRLPPPRYTQSPTTLTWSAVFLEPGWHLAFGDSTYSILVNFLWLYVCKKYPFQLFVCVLFFDSPPSYCHSVNWLAESTTIQQQYENEFERQSSKSVNYALHVCTAVQESVGLTQGEIVMHH